MIKGLLVLLSFVIGYVSANDGSYKSFNSRTFSMQFSRQMEQFDRQARHFSLNTKGSMSKVKQLHREAALAFQNTTYALRTRNFNSNQQIHLQGAGLN